MSIGLRKNEKIKPKWRFIANFIFNSFIVVIGLRSILRLFNEDRIAFDNSLMNDVYVYISACLLVIFFLIHLAFWIKPVWFEKIK